MDIRSLQKPLKEQYRNDPNASQITSSTSDLRRFGALLTVLKTGGPRG